MGLSAIMVTFDRVSILVILVLNRVRLSHSSLRFGFFILVVEEGVFSLLLISPPQCL